MSPPSFDPTAIATTGDVTLVLGRRTSSIKGHRVHMHNDVVTELHGMCDETLARLGERHLLAYADNVNYDSDTHLEHHLDPPRPADPMGSALEWRAERRQEPGLP